MTHLTFGRSKYTAPQSWDECTPAQRWQFTIFHRIPKAERTEQIELMLCQEWLGVSPKAWSTWKMARYQWGNLRKQFMWIWDTEPTGKPAPFFVHKEVTYLLPDDDYTNTTALEVALANMAYLAFANPDEPDLHAINVLIATLCRPQRTDLKTFMTGLEWNGDEREVYNEIRCELRAVELVDLPMPIKVAVLDYFEQMNGRFLQQYGELFGGNAEPRYGDGRGWVMMLKNVAKAGTFGPFDQVCKQPAHLFWATCLDDVLDDRDRVEAEKEGAKQYRDED